MELFLRVIVLKIGIFDSGIGGITVLHEALKMLPHEEFIYYADSKNAPYGTKPKEQVKYYIEQVVTFLKKKDIDVLVIACNTATSIAVKELRERYDFPIIGMEPAVKYALEQEKEKRILVTATDLTLKEEKFQNLVSKLDELARVDSLALPKLVELAEQNIFDREEVMTYLQEALAPFDFNLYGAVVLGCTHFPYFKKYIQEIVPKHIKIVDGNIGTIRHLKNILTNKHVRFSDHGGSIAFYYAGEKDSNNTILNNYLNRLTEN